MPHELQKLSSGALVRVEHVNKSFFLILGELTYYWLDNKGNYYSEKALEDLCRTHPYEIVDHGHSVYTCRQLTKGTQHCCMLNCPYRTSPA